MGEYRNLTRRNLEDGCIVCEEVHLHSGAVCTVYISPRSIYVLSSGSTPADKRYREIQNILGGVRIRLYLLPSENGPAGLYNPLSGALGSQLDEDALSEDISTWLSIGRVIHSRSVMESMVLKLQGADIQSRGYAVQNGEIFLLRNGVIKKASSASSEVQYFLTLFFGTLGFHRFAMGKFFSGLIYFFTSGFFLVGWFLDLLSLLLGIQKDKQKRYLLPLRNRKVCLLLLPLGLFVSLLSFFAYLKVSELLGLGLQNAMVRQIRTTDPQTIERLIDFFANLSSR